SPLRHRCRPPEQWASRTADCLPRLDARGRVGDAGHRPLLPLTGRARTPQWAVDRRAPGLPGPRGLVLRRVPEQPLRRLRRSGRPIGLSIGGRPDFLGLAAWFFDVYLSSRFAGYDEADARFNVAAQITQTDEWRAKHPGEGSATPLPGTGLLAFDRGELLAVME